MLRKGNFAVDMTLRTAASVASAVAATAAEIGDDSPYTLPMQPSNVSAAAVPTSSLSAASYDGVAVSTCGAIVRADDVATFAHASYNNGAYSVCDSAGLRPTTIERIWRHRYNQWSCGRVTMGLPLLRLGPTYLKSRGVGVASPEHPTSFEELQLTNVHVNGRKIV